MIRKNWVFITILGAMLLLSSLSYAVEVNLVVSRVDLSKEVSKYIVRYGPEEKSNAEDYPNLIKVTPENPTDLETHFTLDIQDNDVDYYFAVKEVYEDKTESVFSESSFPIFIYCPPFGITISQ